MGGDERGQSLGIWVLLIGVVALSSLGLVHESRVALLEARAQAIADLAALAGVHDQNSAAEVTRQSGGRLVSIVIGHSETVTVTVDLESVLATASARLDDRPE